MMETKSEARFSHCSGVELFTPIVVFFLADAVAGEGTASRIAGAMLFLVQIGLLCVHYSVRDFRPSRFLIVILPVTIRIVVFAFASKSLESAVFGEFLLGLYAILLLANGDGTLSLNARGLEISRGWRQVKLARESISSVKRTIAQFPILAEVPRLTQFTLEVRDQSPRLGFPFQGFLDQRIRLLVPNEQVADLESALSSQELLTVD
jgi:hypothetical protein